MIDEYLTTLNKFLIMENSMNNNNNTYLILILTILTIELILNTSSNSRANNPIIKFPICTIYLFNP